MSGLTLEAAGQAGREVSQLLLASAKSSGIDPPTELIDFVAETVCALIESGDVISEDEALALLQDAGLELDEDDTRDICSTINFLSDPEANRQAAGEGEGALREGEDGADVDDGCCELCERDGINRTFHHLIPKETHNRYLKRSRLPENMEGFPGSVCTRIWLNTHGVLVCRRCHSAIHHAERNEVLAEQYNTLERLFEHPKILAFAKYNSKQPVRNRVR